MHVLVNSGLDPHPLTHIIESLTRGGCYEIPADYTIIHTTTTYDTAILIWIYTRCPIPPSYHIIHKNISLQALHSYTVHHEVYPASLTAALLPRCPVLTR